MVMVSQQADWFKFPMASVHHNHHQQQQQQQMTMPILSVVDSNFQVSELEFETPGGVDVGCHSENQLGLPMPMVPASCSLESQMGIERKRSFTDEMMEKTIERRQKRMIKNRESAARSILDGFTDSDIAGVWAVQMEVIVNQALLSCAGDTLATILFALVFVNKVLLYSAQFQAIVGLNMPKAKGQHNNESQLKVVDAEEADGDEDDDDNDNGDGGVGEDEDELPSGGGHSDNPNSSNGNAKKGPEEGAGGAGEENGEEEDEEDGDGHGDGDDEDGDEDGEDDDEDGGDEDEEEIVEEEEPAEDEEEDEEEEALQPPKKRKK
ncbi:hypothetical protein HYC85_020150 [Camellia sinensis]|uniref:BZIP domain-containing protein n=1 Tax=Camellia sinensis TaxID=4442 RepID=A0A7J7GSW0_CAMSI|nr:hypothetical protein HYC85_020150 [Camellia sinensis]